MTLKSAPYYWIACDGCGASANDNTDYAAWREVFAAIDTATDRDYVVLDDTARTAYCETCAAKRIVCGDCSSEITDTAITAHTAGWIRDEDGEWFGPKCHEPKLPAGVDPVPDGAVSETGRVWGAAPTPVTATDGFVLYLGSDQ